MKGKKLKLKYMALDELHPDPRNREMFPPLSQEELDYLAASIKDHDLINPITITPDGLIIAGEQRYLAARQLKLETVPVIIRQVTDELEIDGLRLAENLARRNLPPYTVARAIERLAQIKIERLAALPAVTSQKAINQQLAGELKTSERNVWEKRTLAKLIPELGQLLDAQKLRREVALQLAQLDGDDQRAVLRVFSDSKLRWIKAEEMAALKDELKASRKAAEEWKRLVEERDANLDVAARNLAKAKIHEAKVEADEAKRKAKEAIVEIQAKFEEHKQRISNHLDEDRKQPIYMFLGKCLVLLNLDPEETADTLWIPVAAVAEEKATNALALAPWLEKFGKRLRARVREQRGTTLKEVR